MDPYARPIKPMLAQPVKEPFDAPDYLFELKWDGTRALCFVRNGQRFQNRRLYNITHRYPEIRVRTTKDAILDGEIVVMDGGLPSFERLKYREHTGDPLRIEFLSKATPATYVVFDILYAGDQEVMSRPLLERKAILRDILEVNDRVVLGDSIEERGRDYFRAVVGRGLEGILAKRMTSRYHPGVRSRDWAKIKKQLSIDCVIGGVMEGAGERADTFGALFVGAYLEGQLTFLARVGTGFDAPTRQELLARLTPLKAECPFSEVPESEVPVKFWTKPQVVCEVKYLEFTEDGHLRAPTFGRIRDDKAPEDCLLARP